MALGGLSIASIVMQFIAGRFSFYRIMTTGNCLFIIGIFFSLIFSFNPLLLSVGFFINSFGAGFLNGMTFRIIVSDAKYSQNMTMSLLVFMETIIMACGVELINIVCGKFAFSLFSFAVVNFVFAAASFLCFYFFIKMNKERAWK